MPQKPSIPKGTRDFSPSEVAKRNYIIATVKKHFELFGFQPIETPSFENAETLLGKYGEEGDRLIFKILNSGDFIEKFNHLIVKLIRKAVLYHHATMKDQINNVEWNKIEYLNKFKEDFSKLIKLKEGEYFIEEKIPREDLLFDLGHFLFTHTTQTPEMAADFVLLKNNQLEEVMIKIFADWHFMLKSNYFSNYISEKALRYDLTVPFARYVVMHQNEIDFPFKRYQAQPVWRADRPQKGRFREFYQCDADVVGANSLLQEVEFVQLYDAVFTDLGLKGCTIKMNNRKILSGIAEVIGAKQLLVDFTVALDKLDKIGVEKVKEEMRAKGISEVAIEKASPLFTMSGTALDQLEQLKDLLVQSEVGMQGVGELQEIFSLVENLGLQSAQLEIDVTLARGLNYYTGAIFEVAAPDGVQMGSIGGGGRYDDLTGIFGLKDVSGVGISFGLDRIYLVLEELGLFPKELVKSLDVLCLNFGGEEAKTALQLITQLRQHGIRADLYPTATKVQKQFKYADKRAVPFVILLGASELEKQVLVAKNMESGEQKEFSLTALEQLVNYLKP